MAPYFPHHSCSPTKLVANKVQLGPWPCYYLPLSTLFPENKQKTKPANKQTNTPPGNSLYPVTHLLSLGSREKTEQPTVHTPTLLLQRTGKKGDFATTQPLSSSHPPNRTLTSATFTLWAPHFLSQGKSYITHTLFSRQGKNFEIRIKGENSELKSRWFYSRFLCSPEVHSVPWAQGAEFLLESNLNYEWQTWTNRYYYVPTAMAYTNLRNLSIFQISGITDRYQNSGPWACKFLKE